MAKRTISISIHDGLIEDIDRTRGNTARSQFVERVLFLFLHRDESIREIQKEKIEEVVAGYA